MNSTFIVTAEVVGTDSETSTMETRIHQRRFQQKGLILLQRFFGRAPVPPYYVDTKGYSIVLRAKTTNSEDVLPISVSSIFHINYIGGGCTGKECMV